MENGFKGENKNIFNPDLSQNRNRPHPIGQLEKFDDLWVIKKTEILLVMGGFKKATEIEFESGEWHDGEDEKQISRQKLDEFENILKNMGLEFEKAGGVAKSNVGHEEDNYEFIRNVERITYYVAKDKDEIRKLRKAAEEGNDRVMGEMYGFPKTCIDAYAEKGEFIMVSDLPEEVQDAPETAFANFRLSKEHWKEELEKIRSWSECVKEMSPEIYEEHIKTMQQVFKEDRGK